MGVAGGDAVISRDEGYPRRRRAASRDDLVRDGQSLLASRYATRSLERLCPGLIGGGVTPFPTAMGWKSGRCPSLSEIHVK